MIVYPDILRWPLIIVDGCEILHLLIGGKFFPVSIYWVENIIPNWWCRISSSIHSMDVSEHWRIPKSPRVQYWIAAISIYIYGKIMQDLYLGGSINRGSQNAWFRKVLLVQMDDLGVLPL